MSRPADPTAPRVASPCTGVCKIDPASALCLGCARTLDEIARWSALDDAQRRVILGQLRSRHARLPGGAPARSAG